MGVQKIQSLNRKKAAHLLWTTRLNNYIAMVLLFICRRLEEGLGLLETTSLTGYLYLIPSS